MTNMAFLAREAENGYLIIWLLEAAAIDGEGRETAPEQLGEASGQIEVETGDIVGPAEPGDGREYEKNYILMRIGEAEMVFNEARLEIDPGRGTAPEIVGERTMVPIRAVVECMGGTAGWDESARRVSLLSGELSAVGFEIHMTIGSRELTANGEAKAMDVAPAIINGRTMLPLRFAAENAGCEIAWVGSTLEIIIVFFTLAP